MRYTITRRILIFWCLFIGIGAVGGAAGMLIDPSGAFMGMQELLPFFQVMPFADVLFQNLTFAGIALFLVNGVPNLIAAALLRKKKPWGIRLGGLFGVTLMLWICIQFIIFPANFMSTAYFIFGLLQAVTGYALHVFDRQERFCVRVEDYAQIGTVSKDLVVFFSRMGYVRKLAYEAAQAVGGDVYEVKATERTQGTAGFWWCGRFGMHRWAMPIEPVEVDLAAYERVLIVTPIWVFSVCAPIRAFLTQAKGKIRRVEYTAVHYQKMDYAWVFDEMDALLGVRRERATGLCCRQGRVLRQTEAPRGHSIGA